MTPANIMWERELLRTVQFCVRQRWMVALAAVAVALYALGRLLAGTRPVDGGSGTLPTLWDPNRLQTALTLFAETPALSQPVTDRHKTEQLCRLMLERMLGVKLPKVRPKWLTNPTTKRCLELDMYNADLRIAFDRARSPPGRTAPAPPSTTGPSMRCSRHTSTRTNTTSSTGVSWTG